MTYDSSDTKFGPNNNPTHFIVLDAIGRGIKDIDRIAKTTRLPRDEVELIVNDLSSQRLIIKEEKKRKFFGGKKVEARVTETGLRMLNSKKQELEEQAQQLRQWQSNGNTTQLQSYMNSNRSWVPFMLFSGIMDVIFFTSIFSMLGMTMNPMESQMAAESGGGGAEDAATGSETGGEDSSQVGGEADTSGDFGGFDAGGFGDF
ncbi:MAG TPA: MarR family transcriptional regulator [Nitrososphaeraceae archaeon]|nr:MarR family transcriptional regulator [Nitrososphaeraceae archaeon]